MKPNLISLSIAAMILVALSIMGQSQQNEVRAAVTVPNSLEKQIEKLQVQLAAQNKRIKQLESKTRTITYERGHLLMKGGSVEIQASGGYAWHFHGNGAGFRTGNAHRKPFFTPQEAN